jgi:Ca2+-transporting ATPase
VLPILPVQILWINMVTVIALGPTLAFEPKEADIMRRPPRQPDAPILSRVLMFRILMVGAVILGSGYALFEWALQAGFTEAEARTVTVNTVVMVMVFYLFNCRSLIHSPFQVGFFSNRWVFIGILAMVLLQAMFTYAPFMHAVMDSAPIRLEAWGPIVLAGLAGYAVIELEKWVRRMFSREAPSFAPEKAG